MLKNLILWRYGRTTLQYDVLCVLILAFVFLTPKSWFDSGKPLQQAAHRNGLTTVALVVPPDSPPLDNSELERRIRNLPGRATARITAARPVMDAGGRIVAYEVDLE